MCHCDSRRRNTGDADTSGSFLRDGYLIIMLRAVRLNRLCALACVALGACSSFSSPSAHPLAINADGILNPDNVDLSGVPGVTLDGQHRAETLLRSTIVDIQRWADVAQAQRDGFASIGDRTTGNEHFVHWDWINDGTSCRQVVVRRVPSLWSAGSTAHDGRSI
jgi:hypothetical protein